MAIKLTKRMSEGAKKPVTLKIEDGRVYGLTYPMVKACVDSDDVIVYMKDTGPFGEDEGAMIISCDPGDANGPMDLGGGDSIDPHDVEDILVTDSEIGQTGLDWADYYADGVADDIYISAHDLPMAATLWQGANLI